MSKHQSSHPASALDILRQANRDPLDWLFNPQTVAVVGASDKPGSIGHSLMQNLDPDLFGGTLYPVNPNRAKVFGRKVYPRVGAIPGPVDLAVIVTPAATVPGVVRECAEKGVPAAIILSAGFKEIGSAGVDLERQVMELARESGMRILGPNCLGAMRPHLGFNATFAAGMAQPGPVGFISQSGALCTAILDWSYRENVGFSAFISVGSMLDVNWGDLIYYLGDDPHTKSIVIYMESVGDARSFLSAAREVALTKPIIVIKVGRSEAASKAAASHTGSLTGSDEVLEAAFRRAGVLRVNRISELFDMAEVLSKQPRPCGSRLSIVTNAGGPGALATDMLTTGGGKLGELGPDTLKALNELLPAYWSRGNPIDILGDADPERYAKAVEIAAQDPNSDGLLVILTPQAMTDSLGTAERIKSFARLDGKPILTSWMGGAEMDSAKGVLNGASIPTFEYPDTAARAFDYMARYSYHLNSLYETPALPAGSQAYNERQSKAAEWLKTARQARRTLLTEFESKKILETYGISVVPTHLATTEEAAVEEAERIGYPVVLKLHSETLTHKTDVNGVRLNLREPGDVRNAWQSIADSVREKAGADHFLGVTVQPMISLDDGYELILGSSIDPQFGPVLLFGTGGQLVEVFQDRALGLPPLNATLARRMMEQTRIYRALKGVRGREAVDLAELEQLLVRFSHLVAEQPWIKEIDINPLYAAPGRLAALDARVITHDWDLTEARLPRPAIRPYPVQYVESLELKDGSQVTVRPIRPEDEPLMVQFHETLSEESIYYRYFAQLKLDHRISHERLRRICFTDYDREIALVIDHRHPETGGHSILGVGRLSKMHGRNEAEFALLISDAWQNQGLGSHLLKKLVHIGRQEQLSRITARLLPDNRAMHRVCRKVGFQLHHQVGDPEWTAEKVL